MRVYGASSGIAGGGNVAAGNFISYGALPATSGTTRYSYPFTVKTKDSANADRCVIDYADTLYFGSTRTATEQISQIFYCSGSLTSFIVWGNATPTVVRMGSAGLETYGANNLGLMGNGTNSPDAASGTGVFAIGNRTAAPSGTPAGGGVLYAEAGALKWKGSSGTVTTIAVA